MSECPRVLVVEDEPIWRDRIVQALASVECTLEEVSSHGEALSRIMREPFALVIVDLFLPVQDEATIPTGYFEGEDLLMTLREQGLYSIVLTDYAKRKVNRRIIRNNPGVCDIVPKIQFDRDPSFEEHGFAEVVRKALHKAAQANRAEGLSAEQLARLDRICS